MFEGMKRFYLLFIVSAILFFTISCKKNSFTASFDSAFLTSVDTLHFDTVFTSSVSVTKVVKIYNINNQKLRVNNIFLAGGSSSFFKMIVDGLPGVSFSDIDIAANDSIYVFVSVNIAAGVFESPFLIQDSILISYNGYEKYIQLDAYGQNAIFLNNVEINTDTTWSSELPFVIRGGLTINEGHNLSIENGCRIYLHANAPVYIKGSININGTSSNRVIFAGDRLDDPYKYFPASWPGLIFYSSSKNNILNFVTLSNASQAIQVIGDGTENQLSLNGCIIDNCLNEGIKATNASVKAINCLIANCGQSNLKLMGGNFSFIHCTVASYSNVLLNHNSSVLYVSDQDDEMSNYPVSAVFNNSIFYGQGGLVEDETFISHNSGNIFNVSFQNVLYKAMTTSDSYFINSIKNEDPAFAILDFENTIFDFHLLPTSPCIDAGIDIGVSSDLEGNKRNVLLNNPDIGCYEYQ